MIKRLTILLLIALLAVPSMAQKGKPEISFDRKTINLGTFPAEDAVKIVHFTFTNTGDADLYIHQIFTSCRCTGKEFPTHAIKPGAQDSIIVIFNGEKSAPRKFRTGITIHSNAKTEMTKVYIKGEMLPAKVEELEVIEVEE